MHPLPFLAMVGTPIVCFGVHCFLQLVVCRWLFLPVPLAVSFVAFVFVALCPGLLFLCLAFGSQLLLKNINLRCQCHYFDLFFGWGSPFSSENPVFVFHEKHKLICSIVGDSIFKAVMSSKGMPVGLPLVHH